MQQGRTKATNLRQLEFSGRSPHQTGRLVAMDSVAPASDPSGLGRFNEWWQWVSKRAGHILGRLPDCWLPGWLAVVSFACQSDFPSLDLVQVSGQNF